MLRLSWGILVGLALMTLWGCRPALPSATVRDFGTTRRGEVVRLFKIDNGRGMRVEFLDYGARIKSIVLPDRNGEKADVTIGFDSVGDYEKYDYGINAFTGRYANRIANGRFVLDEVVYDKLFLNNGPEPDKMVCTLHGGKSGFGDKVWKGELYGEDGAFGVKFTYVSPDGEEGFPGTLTTEVRYLVTTNNILRAEYVGKVADKPTVINYTNHIYFNLRGDDRGDTLDQPLQFFAHAITPVDRNLIPTGEIRPVAGTVFDFNTPIGQGAHCRELDNEQLAFGGGYDHNWVLTKHSAVDRYGNSTELELAAVMTDLVSGRKVEIWTVEPGLQMWGGQALHTKGNDRTGNPRRDFGALALETQHFPDSPNHSNFPTTVLRPGETYRTCTEYRFSY